YEVWPEDHEKSTKKRSLVRGSLGGNNLLFSRGAHPTIARAAPRAPTRHGGPCTAPDSHACGSAAAAAHDSRSGYPGHRAGDGERPFRQPRTDRKSTRLNSSHRTISYAVF